MKLLYLTICCFCLYCITGCFTVHSNESFSYNKLSPAAYAAVLKDSSNYYLVDARTAAEYKRSHLPGAVNFRKVYDLKGGYQNRANNKYG